MYLKSLVGFVAGYSAASQALIFSEQPHAIAFAGETDLRAFMADVHAFGQSHQLAGCAVVA